MNILLTSIGRRSYMVKYFQEALRGQGLVHVSNNVECSAFHIADKFVVTPDIYDEGYIQFLIDYVSANSIKAIIPMFDVDLPILSACRQMFKKLGTEVFVSDTNTCRIANDKWETYSYLLKEGFAVPKTYLHLSDCINDLNYGTVKFPLIVKPRWGMGSIGIFEAISVEELRVFIDVTHRIISKSYLQFESKKDLCNSVIVQEKLLGDEIGLDVICDLDGRFLYGVPLKIIDMRGGESHSVLSIEDEELVGIGKILSKSLLFRGCWNIDVIKHDACYSILEINNRLNGLSPFSILAGANYPEMILDMLRGQCVKDDNLNAQPGLTMYKNLSPVKYQIHNHVTALK